MFTCGGQNNGKLQTIVGPNGYHNGKVDILVHIIQVRKQINAKKEEFYG